MKTLLLFPASRPRLTLLIAAIFTLIAGIGAMRLSFQATLDSMFPEHDPAADAMERVLDRFATANELLVLATGEPDKLTSFLKTFQTVASGGPARDLSLKIVAGIDPDAEEFVEHEMAPAGLLYLSDREFASAKARLSPDGMRAQLARDRAMLTQPGPGAGAIAKALMADPLDMRQFLLSRLAAMTPGGLQTRSDALLIRIYGVRPPTDLKYAAELTRTIEDAAAQASAGTVHVSLAGAYAVAAEDQASIRRDAYESVIGSVLLLILLFVVAYRRPLRLFCLAFAPIVVGIFWGFGAYGFLRGPVSPIAAVIGGVLAGMGIDYSVLYLTRFEALRAAGAAVDEAARQTATDVSSAVFAAFVTSVAGFLAIGFSSVKALRDFSILGTLGLAGCFIAALAIGPALLVLASQKPTQTAFRFSMSPFLNWMFRRRIILRVAAGFVAAASLFIIAVPGERLLQPESDLTVMHPRPNAALDTETDISRRFGVAPGVLLLDLHATDENSLISKAYEVQRRLAEPGVRGAGIAGTYGLANWLPDPKLAARRLGSIKPGEGDSEAADFDAAVGDSGFNPSAFKGYKSFLRLLMEPPAIPNLQTLDRYSGIGRDLLPFTKMPTKNEAITIIFLRDGLEDRAERDATIQAVRGALAGVDGTVLTGLPVISHDAELAVNVELPRLLWIAATLVAAYLLLHFRNLRFTWLSLLPAVFGFITLAAMVRLVGVRLNLVNLISLPLLIGIDVDYGIYLVSLSRRGKVEATLPGGVHAVCVCAISMIAGYASLTFTSVPALRSLGLVVAFGAATCLIGAIFILCPILKKDQSALDATA